MTDLKQQHIYFHKLYKFQASLHKIIIIRLHSFDEPSSTFFLASFALEDMPHDLQKQFKSTSHLFKLFSDEENFTVDPKRGLFALKVKKGSDHCEYIFHLHKVFERQSNGRKRQYEKMIKEDLKIKKLQNQREKLEEEIKTMQTKQQKLLLTLQRKEDFLHKITSVSTIHSLKELNLPFPRYFSMESSILSHSGKDYQWSHTLVERQIHPQYDTFHCKILKSKAKRIFIGVTDYLKQKNQFYSHHSGNSVSIWGLNGKVWSGKNAEENYQDKGIGFEEGDKVTMELFLSNGIMKWAVNGCERGKIEAKILREKGRKFVPFVDFFNKDDCIEWLD